MSPRESLLAPPGNASVPVGGPDASHRPLRGLAIAATAATFVLVAVGGLVRATGSGLGCSGWPKCSADRWLPPLQYHAIIEYSHRMTAFVDIVLVALLAVVAWRRYRDVPRVFWTAQAAVGLIVAQAVLGAIVVKGDLAALLVTAHFATAMVLAATLVAATVASFTLAAHPRGKATAVVTLARVTAASAFALLLVGAYVRGDNAGLAFADWPLMDGRLVPPLHFAIQSLMFTHRVLALAVGVLVVSLALVGWQVRRRLKAVAALALVAAGLFVAQVLIGAALVWSKLSAPARVAHVTVSSLIWGALVAAGLVAGALDGHSDAVSASNGAHGATGPLESAPSREAAQAGSANGLALGKESGVR